ncbi:MAG: hypothetical protein ABIP48_12760 [Planctomycetota bacterium]
MRARLRFVRQLLALSLAMAHGGTAVAENLLRNGDFSADAQHWVIQVDNKHDGSIKVEGGTLVVRRTRPDYFMRAYERRVIEKLPKEKATRKNNERIASLTRIPTTLVGNSHV